MINFYDHHNYKRYEIDDGSLQGLRHKTIIDRQTGARSLALWQEEHLPDFTVPFHFHDCEEIITVLDGKIRAVIKDKIYHLEAEQSILIPARALHSFRVVSKIPVRLLAIFSSNNPEIFRTDGTRSKPPWEGGTSDHLES